MKDVMGRKLFRPRNARNKLNAMGGIMASSPELMGAVQKFNVGGNVQAQQPSMFTRFPKIPREYGVGAGGAPRSLMTTGIVPTLEDSFLGRGYRALTSGPSAAEMASNPQPVESPTPQVFGSAVASEGMPREPIDLTPNAPPYSPPVSEETNPLSDSILPEDMVAPGTREAEEEGMGEGVVTGYEQATSAVTDAAAVVNSDLPKPVQGAVIADTVKKVVNMQGLSAKEINEQVLELAGQKDPDKDLSRSERMKKNIELYKSLFKEDPKDIKTENGFNLAFMGFAIAAGKDPNALTNLAEGAKQGLSKFAESSKARKQRERDAKVFGLTQTLKEEDDIRKQRHRMMELKFGANVDLIKQRFATEADMAKWAATQTIAERQLTRKLDASVKELGLRLDAADRQNIISNLPEASVYWLQANPDATAEDLSNPEVVDEIANLAIKMSPGSRGKTPDPGKTRPAYIQEGVAKATEDPGTRFNIAQALGKPVEQLTTQDIQNYYGNVWDSSSGQPATSGTTITLEPDEG